MNLRVSVLHKFSRILMTGVTIRGGVVGYAIEARAQSHVPQVCGLYFPLILQFLVFLLQQAEQRLRPFRSLVGFVDKRPQLPADGIFVFRGRRLQSSFVELRYLLGGLLHGLDILLDRFNLTEEVLHVLRLFVRVSHFNVAAAFFLAIGRSLILAFVVLQGPCWDIPKPIVHGSRSSRFQSNETNQDATITGCP